MQENSDNRFLLLIRHSAVFVDQHKPVNEWSLSEEGRDRCRQFAPLIAPFQPTLFVTSSENKAVETGLILAKALCVPSQIGQNLHEHDRRGEPFFANQQERRNTIRRLFTYPEILAFGRETAAQAGARFDSAVKQLIDRYQDRSLAVVTHGTVLTLFVCHYNPCPDPMTFWSGLKMPCAVLLRLPDMAFRELILPSTTGSNLTL